MKKEKSERFNARVPKDLLERFLKKLHQKHGSKTKSAWLIDAMEEFVND